MKFLNGVSTLLVYQLVGEVTTNLLHLPVPGPVLGMTLLFLTLLCSRRVSIALDTTSNALLNHLSLLFIPAGVGVMVHFDRLSAEWIPITIALVLSTLLTITGSAAAMAIADRLLTQKLTAN
ncbi:MAG: CidA/LrgA family protein [Synechococcus sp.]